MDKRTSIDWYRERAEWFGMRVYARLQNMFSDGVHDDDYTRGLAMLAGHFGALVLGYASLEGKQIVVMDMRVVPEPMERYYVPHGAAIETLPAVED